ncbi:M56 family metallopeptidase [Dysgonomonas macrotermitis]|uniref:TonB-dependent outer membrane receptor, SusC/RagA subfamily, signature region n=1 Tax=Dysgonomonas macrotermitis TaxID=1346286 RepID=A0A1M5F5J6_9BACT|nr:M56 family metallopeptidase [Dysgonomonas macrotermitis]SHF86779.1 TonB-dependent outer membrane receptor, SusC/RagA subfamily, signature region [Dysgonomonas macrotermitis]
MKDFLIHIIYSGICLSLFWMVYRFLLSNITFYAFNRLYLVIGLVLSFVLPCFVITYDVVLSANIVSQPDTGSGSPAGNPFSYWLIAGIIYIAGIVVLFLRNLRSYYYLINLLGKGERLMSGKYKVIEEESVNSPFTVFNCIVLNTSRLSGIEKELILKHEIVHIDKKHWIDLVCSECALLLQWFNPVVWLYVSSIKENHEFQADNAVIAQGVSPALYRAVLVNQRLQGPVFSFANSFSLLNKSNRLAMIKKEKSALWKRSAVLTVLPLLGLFFWVSATPRYVYDANTDEVVSVADSTEKVPQFRISPVEDKNKSGNKDSEGKEQSGQNQPLVIVDGKVVSYSEMNNILPDTIDRIEVLKDESSVAVYGDRGKNGVIIITLKKK